MLILIIISTCTECNHIFMGTRILMLLSSMTISGSFLLYIIIILCVCKTIFNNIVLDGRTILSFYYGTIILCDTYIYIYWIGSSVNPCARTNFIGLFPHSSPASFWFIIPFDVQYNNIKLYRYAYAHKHEYLYHVVWQLFFSP